MCRLVRPNVPRYGRRRAVDDTVCGPDGVGVAIVANGRDGEVCGGGKDVGEIPGEGNGVGGGDLEERGCRLGRFCDREAAGWRRDGDAAGRGRGRARVALLPGG